MAQASCELLAKKYGSTAAETQGKVYILLGIDSIFSHRRTGGFKAGLEKYCPNVEIVGEQTASGCAPRGRKCTIAWQKDPDIDLFYGNSDEMAIGAALAGEQLGKVINQDFFAVGIDGNQPTLDLLGEGKFSATLGVDPVRMGVTVVDTMQKVLDGQEVPQILLTPSVVVTPENLQDYLDGKLWTEPVAGFPEIDNDQPTVPDEGAMTEPAAMGPMSGAGKTVGFVPPALTSPFHVAMVDGATAEAALWLEHRRAGAGQRATSRHSSPPSSSCWRRASMPSASTPSAPTRPSPPSRLPTRRACRSWPTTSSPRSRGRRGVLHRLRPVGRRRELAQP
ncbi:MAG: substrate-binding domain-containing protein [Caldilineales bacterium]